MFRAQGNIFDDVVVKATDENLTSENWEYILDVCDKVGSSDTGAQQVVQAMIRRLAHRNANVQLYTLELANALSQNCGIKMHKELASRSFTEALLRLANDRNTHQQVKAKILERMSEWSDMFSRDPDLGIMQGAYTKLKSQNPNLRAPSKPQKTQISDSERQKEEEELQMALAMSIRESKGATPATAKSNAPQDASAGASSSSQPAQPQAPAPQGTTAATVSRVRALYDFQPSEPGELQFKKGDIIAVLESVYKDWWKGSLRGQTGIFPLNYVEKLQDPTREELEREAQMEAEVFAQIRNVEKLLALLSTSSQGGADIRENEEITELYHSTLAIRPKLIELIGKYSQKKDDFTQLNEKFIKGRRDYESLLEASMTQAAQPSYSGRPGYGAYTAPPPSQYAAYPPSSATPQDPNRFYGAGVPPQQGQSQYPPASSNAQGAPYPPAGSNPAFFMVPPAEQRQQQTPAPQGPPSNTYNDPSLNRVPVGRPQSFAPQELSTGHYDSPVDNRASFHGAPPGAPPGAPIGQDYPAYPPQQQTQPPGYPPQAQASAPPQNPYEHITSPPPQQHEQAPSDSYAQAPQQNQYGYPPQQAPSQPGYAPPAPPGATSSPAPQQTYLPYRPSGQAPPAAGGDEGFYR
ncbi:uncharacterized protein M421DRAFT_426243 [Didymella exigua CBS 183.55]|uniref:Class E vacuolar protein-sorting machinery protein HSE1 n=1 Tax=Didymella exigua CBS 183.55 TaxID=1150837 RepID=A0A6A5R4J4_9PLEO|nr:uncharacterized protein M421DRAFT_426243 [Didymella exigua CBS 183.55]KAF1923011.1 hypothetical protein M421DRAFT_426243 [Didymella exigua CBS 183.55]